MRSCIYCGRELEKGEKCTCAKSTKNRETTKNTSEKNTESTYQNSGYNDPNRTQYQTGYTRKDNPFKKAYEKAKAKSSARKTNGKMDSNFWRAQLDSFMEALKNPVSAVHNPKDMSMGAMLVLWAMLGAVMWLCLYFIITNVPRGPFTMLANVMSFRGIEGYKVVGYMLMTIASGAVSGVLLFLAYAGIFFGINRLVFRDRQTMFKGICQRLALTAVPFTAICIIGALISMFSSTTLMILLISGAITFVVLTYEALKVQWVHVPPGKVVYGMMLGFFILLSLICYIIRLS